MRVIFGTESYTGYGMNLVYSLIGDYLEYGLSQHGEAIEELQIVACFRGWRTDGTGVDSLYEPFHNTRLPSLPIVRFYRKKRRLVLEYETKVVPTSFLQSYKFDAVVFRDAMAELANVLHLLDTRVKKSDAFDVEGLHADLAKLLTLAPQTDEALKALHGKLQEEKRQKRAAMDPWKRLGIDWGDYHPKAREALDNPFFWEEANDHAPHGNDTGADLLHEFRRWNRRHPDEPAYKLAVKLLREWDMADFDFHAKGIGEIASLPPREMDCLRCTDEAILAAAFAAIKIRGQCDRESRSLALASIERERHPAVLRDAGWQDVDERLEKLSLLERALGD